MPVSTGSIYNISEKDLPDLEKAAKNGDAKACERLVMYYSTVVLDENMAVHWLDIGANQGDPKAQYNLAQRLIRANDLHEAKKWACRALENGLPAAEELIKEIDESLKSST